jgi:hypothetical protein
MSPLHELNPSKLVKYLILSIAYILKSQKTEHKKVYFLHTNNEGVPEL